MVSQEQARKVAEGFLDREVRSQIAFDVVIVDSSIRETDEAWLFGYDGRGRVERDDPSEMLAGNLPVRVDKKTGEVGFNR